MGKKERHAAIMELIQQKSWKTGRFDTSFVGAGNSVTQATISRDIQLQLVKQHLENGVCLLPSAGTDTHF
ncbi:MAG: hypothetical protein ACLS6W_00905 [Ruminococcus sp.]